MKSGMNTLIKLEELAQFLISIALFIHTEFAWWMYPLFLLLPDISMIGYAITPKIGAISYNLFHHKAVALVVLSLGFVMQINWLFFAGIILFGHSSMDRMIGYGLKHFDSFKNTHLGKIGN